MVHLHALVRIARYLWVSPCTAVGLCLSVPLFLCGARARVVDGVIEVAVCKHDGVNVFFRALPFIAITFGHVVLAINQRQLHRLRAHEHEHVRQYERWGILFFAAYPAASLWQWVRGRRPYLDNCFEIAARAQESQERSR